jgi:hypothetical protein
LVRDVLTLAAVFSAAAIMPAAESTDNLPPSEATEIWQPVPRVVEAPAGGIPSDAIVLFSGKNLDAWESATTPGTPATWRVEEGACVIAPKSGDIRTKQAFGDIQLHLEWRTPAVVKGGGQARGNSGVYFMGLYELQVLDSYQNPTYVNGQAGSIYKQHAPLVNASRRPGEWQTYDVIWTGPRFAADGKLERPAYITVFQNGVLVQYHAPIAGPTTHRGTPPYVAHAAKLPLLLQDHGDPIGYRNIWVRELALPDENKFDQKP